MIKTQQKPFSDVLDLIEAGQPVLILGCGSCARLCRTGGAPEVAEMRARLEAHGLRVVEALTPPENGSLCLTQADAQWFVDLKTALDEAGTVLTLSCNRGLATMTKLLPGKRVVCGCDTLPE